jgi:hypothetical protein
MIESFLYATWICCQVLYWVYLRDQIAVREEECWRILNILTCPGSTVIGISACAARIAKIENFSFCSILLVVFSPQFPISQVGTNNFGFTRVP